MGDPKFPRRRFDTPSHPWNAPRIQAEKGIVRKYGLKNKREVWKAQTKLRVFRRTARQLIAKQAQATPQQTREAQQLITRMNRMGLLTETSTLDDVLGINIENLLTRRLQTIVYLKGLAGTPRQARQFIVHGHVLVGGRRVTVPSYLLSRGEEDAIVLDPRAAVADPAHPVRARPESASPMGDMRPRTERAPRAETPVPADEMSEAEIPEAPAADEGGEPQ